MMSNEEEKKCPLCAEEMDWTDQQLKPCKCGYEVCIWCWHHIMDMAEKDEMEGRCPACRTLYDKEKIVGLEANCERPVASKKDQAKPQKAKPKRNEGRTDLTGVRVIQRKMAYIIGLPFSLADEDLLQRKEYFGQYGKVSKVSLSRTVGGAIQQFVNDSCSVYVTYSKEEEAIRCIRSVHGFVLEDRFLRASFGTAKYCHAWLRNMPCTNPTCLYLHSVGAEEDSFGKDEEAAVHTRNRVHQIVEAKHNMQQRSGTMLPPPIDEPLNSSGITTDKAIVKNFPKDTDHATVTSSGHWTRSLSSNDQDGHIKTPNSSSVDIVGRSSSGPENGNIAKDRKLLNFCSEFSSVAIDKDHLEAEYSNSMLCKLSSCTQPIALPWEGSQQYSDKTFSESSTFSVLHRAELVPSDACITEGQSSLISNSGRQVFPGSCSDMREDLLSLDNQRLKGSDSLIQGLSVLPLSYPVRMSDSSNGHAQQFKETCRLSDFNVDHNTVYNHVDESSKPFTSVNSVLTDGFNGRNFLSSTDSGGNFRCSNSFSNDEIVEQLRRLDDDSITNDDDSSALDVVESSIISNILSMDFDSCDDSLTLPHSLAELFDETDRQHGSSRNLCDRDQSRFSFASEENSYQATDFNSSCSDIGRALKKYPSLPNTIGKEEHYMCEPQHRVSRAQSLTPLGFSVPSREPPPGFSACERTNQVLSANSGSHLVKTSSLPNNQYCALSAGNIKNTCNLDFNDPAKLFSVGGTATNGFNSGLETRPTSTPQLTPYEDEARLWLLKQQSASAYRDSIFSPIFMQETPSACQERRFSGGIEDGYSLMGDALGIPSRLMDQHQTYNPSSFVQLPHQIYGNRHISNGYQPRLDEIRVRSEVGMAEIQRNERLGLNNFFPGHGDLMLQMPSTGGLYNRVYGL